MALKLFYIHVTPGQINGCLAARDNKLLIIVPNYVEVFETPPAVTDDSNQVFAVGVPEDEIRAIGDNGVGHYYVWKGDPLSRSKPQDKATLEILSLVPFTGPVTAEVAADPATAAGPVDPQKVAADVFAGIPPEVKLASVIGAIGDDVLGQVPDMSPARIAPARAWAKSVVDAFIAKQG